MIMIMRSGAACVQGFVLLQMSTMPIQCETVNGQATSVRNS
jgi:hypothetical protein